MKPQKHLVFTRLLRVKLTIVIAYREQNAAARLIVQVFTHIATLLRQLHWLPVHYRILKTFLIAFKAINGQGLEYISCLVCIRSQGEIIYIVRMSSSLTDCIHRTGPIRHWVTARPFSIVLAFFSAFFGKTSIFFGFLLEKEFLAFSIIFHDCDPDFSTQKDK